MSFYESEKWLELRNEVIKLYGKTCMKCSMFGNHVDHIKPRGIHYRHELDIRNLQVLCETCNIFKSYLYEEDYRTEEQRQSLDLERERNKIISKYYGFLTSKNRYQRGKSKFLLRKRKDISKKRRNERKREKRAKLKEINIIEENKKTKTILRKRNKAA